MARSSFPSPQDDFARALLRSAEQDEPSSGAYAKAASALGVGIGVGVGAAAPAVAARASLVNAAHGSASLLLRWLALGVSGAALLGAGALWSHSGAAPSSAHPGTAPEFAREQHAQSKATPILPAPSAAGALVSESPLSDRMPSSIGVQPRSGSAHSISRKAGSSREPSSSLVEQVQSLDRARVALGAGDPGTALAEIAHYRKAWPTGVFLTEASVLEIEALAVRGERSLAAARASAFVQAHPDSPQAGRLRAFLPVEPR